MRFFFTFALFFCVVLYSGQNLIMPNGYTVLDEENGDLDKDGVDEKVIVYNTMDSSEFGTVREIQILKKSSTTWTVWKKSRNAILKSEEGGMMGDPFQEIQIMKGILKISFAGGSSWKWSFTDKYRFQNGAFELIGHSSVYGKPCEYWADLDFNLSTGKVIYKKEIEHCADSPAGNEDELRKNENETFYKKGLRLNLDNRHSEEIKIVSPVHKYELYL